MEPRKPISNGHNSSLESVDRISALPDCLLGVILSLLPTKTTFTTSILSKRWKFLWRTVHNLDFCLKDVVEEGGEDKEFVGFVNHVLLHHEAGVALNKFRLEWWYFCIESIATSWIKTATTRNVHELSLILFACHGPFDMPISVFSCDSLRSLQMQGGFYLSAATVFCLPRLETLHLNRVTFQSDKALEKIIRGCPMLHDLLIAIDEEDEEVEFTFIIFSTSLRRLELYSFSVRHKYLKLEAYSLEHLKLFGYISVNFVPKKLTSLVEANFEIYLDCDDFSKAGTCNSVVDAVSVLDCLKILTLSADVMRALSCATRSLSTDFKRLVKLEASIECCRWSSLIDLIQRSNNLQLLTIRKCLRHPDGGNDHDHLKWTAPVEVPRCLSTTLKEVVVDGYRGYEDQQHEMICYMLKHGSVLEGMKVSGRMDEIRKRIESAQEIGELPRKVEFHRLP